MKFKDFSTFLRETPEIHRGYRLFLCSVIFRQGRLFLFISEMRTWTRNVVSWEYQRGSNTAKMKKASIGARLEKSAFSDEKLILYAKDCKYTYNLSQQRLIVHL